MRAYFAGPLFSASELEYNRHCQREFGRYGIELMLPQDNGFGIDGDMMLSDRGYAEDTVKTVADADLKLLESCDILIFNMDGRVPDEGACFELGYAYGRHMRCYGLQTDVRRAEYGINNMMIERALIGRIGSSVEEAVAYIMGDAGLKPA